MKHATAIALVLGFQLAACDGPTEPPTPKAEAQQQTQQPSPTPFDSQIKTLKKAEQVGGELEKTEADRQQQLEQATQ